MFANPRFDFPPGFNFEPWFARYSADIALETGRLSHFLDDLEQDRRIALLYPTRTVWADTQQGPHARDFGRWAEILTAANIPFDIVDEQMLGTGLPSYDAVVLPAVTILASRESVERIGDLLARGGEVLVSGRTPVAYQHGPQTAAEDWAALEARGADRITRYEEAPAAADALARFRGPAPAAGTSAIAVVAGVGPDGRRRLAAFNDGTTPAELALHPEDGEVLVVRDAASGEVRSVVRADSDQRMQPAELLLIEQVDDAPHDAAGEDVGPATCQALADGWTVRVADTDDDLVLRDVDPARGLEEQGLPAFSGVVTYSRTVVLDAPGRLLLDLPAVVGGAEVFLNGRCVGRRGWAPYVYRIAASDTVAGENHLQIEVAGTAANRYYAGTGMRDRPDPCGIIGTPRLHVLT
jgi:hypothetical protein